MLPLRYPRLWLSLGWAAVAFAIVVCLIPANELPHSPNISDKTEHLVAYMLLSLWFAGIYPRSRYWIIAIGLCVMGVLIEFAQGAMRLGRQADVADVLANSTGVIVGLGLSLLWLGGWAQRIETWVGKSVVNKS
jgi:VanZ family protein